MRTLIKTGFSLLILAFVLIGLSYSVLRAQGVSAPVNREGRTVATETRDLATGVRTIELTGPINMTLRQGPVASLLVRGEQRLLSHVTTEQVGGTLSISTKGIVLHHRTPLQVVLVLPSIEGVNVHGSGDSTVNGFSGDHIEVSLRGSGSVKLNGRFKDVNAGVEGSGNLEVNAGNSERVEAKLRGSGQLTLVGSCDELEAEQNGSGDFDARHLTARKATMTLHGSGNATIHAENAAEVTLHGNGDVVVHGMPKNRNVSRTGSGEVAFRH
jgi:hypothetical protein